jgi:hypothetical protein
LACQKAQAANQLLLSPYSTSVVSLLTPDWFMRFSNCDFGKISRTTVSQSCVFQAQAMAPGTWPSSYDLVSTSISTTRTFGSVA